MRHLRLLTLAALAAMIVAAGATGALLAAGRYAPAALAALATAAAAIYLIALTRRPLRAIDIFASALGSNDSTTLIPLTDDPDINHTAHVLNRIAADRAASALALETRKLYYDRILRVITHEMRNSIAPVAAISRDMADNPDCYSGDALAEAATLISSQAASIQRFLDSYYELTHLPEPSLAAIDGREMLRTLQKIAAPHAERLGIPADRLTIHATQDLTFTADRDLILRALTNILRNALDAVGGSLDPAVKITATRLPDGGISFTITDNGPGLSPAIAANLFQPFVTTKAGGSGIGLCLARQIARLHGGDLSYQPAHPGASFALTVSQR